jgi:hypothetical protein
MNAPRTFLPPTTALRRLADFLVETGSTLSPTEAATLAINNWIVTAKTGCTPPTSTRGYQWKSLFLPEGTELRMCYRGQNCYAHVTGDDIIYQGRPVSPRQLALEAAGDGRNAWRDVWVRLPGDAAWRPAARLRRDGAAQPAPKPVAPAEALGAAASCMAEALKAALALVEHAHAQALPQYERRVERRVERHRRAQDLMEDACRSD